VLVYFQTTENQNDTADPAYQSPVGGGLTYTLLDEVGVDTLIPWTDASPGYRLSGAMWTAPVGATPSAFTITGDPYSGSTLGDQDACACDITGLASATPVQHKTNGGHSPFPAILPGSVTLDAAPTPGNVVIVAFAAGVQTPGSAAAVPTAGTGKTFTQLHNEDAGFAHASLWYRVWDGTESNTITTSALSATNIGNWVAVAAEFPADNGPANVPPTVDAGADQTGLTGTQVTLTATAADTDGTIASYVWSQVSGAAVTLAGTGATRTFTPTAAGVRVFSVQAFDDDGAGSNVDTVTVITTSPPVTGGGTTPEQADADALAVVLAHLKAHPTVTGLFGTSVSGMTEGPWPHLTVTDGPGGDLRDGRWAHDQEIILEAHGNPSGTPGKAALKNMLFRAVAAVRELPDLPVLDPTAPVVSRVRSTGVLVWNPMANGQGVYTTSVMVSIHPPLVLP
jgi:hypothetical protein